MMNEYNKRDVQRYPDIDINNVSFYINLDFVVVEKRKKIIFEEKNSV